MSGNPIYLRLYPGRGGPWNVRRNWLQILDKREPVPDDMPR